MGFCSTPYMIPTILRSTSLSSNPQVDKPLFLSGSYSYHHKECKPVSILLLTAWGICAFASKSNSNQPEVSRLLLLSKSICPCSHLDTISTSLRSTSPYSLLGPVPTIVRSTSHCTNSFYHSQNGVLLWLTEFWFWFSMPSCPCLPTGG